MDTPFFPPWRPFLAPLGRRLQEVRRATVSQLEECLAGFLPGPLLGPCEAGPHSRQRVFTLRRTFWGFLSQVLTPHTSCREVVRQFQALLGLHTREPIDSASSAYCQARGRLPLPRLEAALPLSAQAADQRRGDQGRLNGRPVKVVDGTTVQLPDTPDNQRRYPQPRSQQPGCGFPVMKPVALFSLASGAILAVARENLHWHDLRLFRRLWSWLQRGDILLGDRAFGDFVTLAQLPAQGVDVVARLHSGRKVDFRRGQSLGLKDALFTWSKTAVRPKYLTRRQWQRLPGEITVRVLCLDLSARGFRTRRLALVTTLLDPRSYPAPELFDLYRRRWCLELCFRDLKTTMGMEHLRCHSPAMVHKELLMFLIAHNLIRALIAQAARTHDVDPQRISFKGSVDATRQFSGALAQARTQRQRRRLQGQLLAILAEDLVPHRPNRREPRAVKRRPKPFRLLNRPRHQFREIPHRNRYWRNNPRKSRG
jgi:hypothetical protein